MKASDIKLPAHDQDEIDFKLKLLDEQISDAVKELDRYFVLTTECHDLTSEPHFEVFGNQDWITDLDGLYAAMVRFIEDEELTPENQLAMNTCGLGVQHDKYFIRSKWKIHTPLVSKEEEEFHLAYANGYGALREALQADVRQLADRCLDKSDHLAPEVMKAIAADERAVAAYFLHYICRFLTVTDDGKVGVPEKNNSTLLHEILRKAAEQ